MRRNALRLVAMALWALALAPIASTFGSSTETVVLDKYGWFWFKPPANAYGQSGIADIIALFNGCFLAIETKFGSNKPTQLQVAFLNSIRAHEGMAFVVNEKNLEWLDAYLESFQRATVAASNGTKPAEEDGARMLNALPFLMKYAA